MILNCAIIDDEPLAAELLASYARRLPELRLTGVYGSAVEAMTELRGNPADIIFLDIQMPELSGLELAAILPRKTKIVFTTAFDRYAIDGYKVRAVDYLLKPVSFEKFVAAVNRVAELTEAQQDRRQDRDDFIYVKSEYKLVRIGFGEILYVEGLKDYIKIYLTGGRKPVMSLMNMKMIEETLPSPPFLRVHRSYIVNMPMADMIDRGRIVVGRSLIPVSEGYREQLLDYVESHTLQ